MLSGPYINLDDTVTSQGQGVVLMESSLDEPKLTQQPLRPILLKFVNDFLDSGHVELSDNGKIFHIDADMYEKIYSLVAKAKTEKNLSILDGATGLGFSKDEFANIYFKLERIFSIYVLEEYFFSSHKAEEYFATIDGIGDSETGRHKATEKLIHRGFPAHMVDTVIAALILASTIYHVKKETASVLSGTTGN